MAHPASLRVQPVYKFENKLMIDQLMSDQLVSDQLMSDQLIMAHR